MTKPGIRLQVIALDRDENRRFQRTDNQIAGVDRLAVLEAGLGYVDESLRSALRKQLRAVLESTETVVRPNVVTAADESDHAAWIHVYPCEVLA